MTRRRLALLVGLAAGILAAAPALAHPHVWITARAELVFDPEGRVAGVRHAWTFDEAYSAYATQGVPRAGDGTIAPEALADLAAENAKNIEEFGYFTRLKVSGRQQAFEAPREPRMVFAKGQATLGFLLPLKAPAAPGRGAVALEVYDPTFFVAFALADDADAARLAGAPKGCTASVTRSKSPEGAAQGGQPLSEAFFSALSAASTYGAQFSNRILVACP